MNRYAEWLHAECHFSVWCYAECRYVECHYAECHYAECRYANYHGASVTQILDEELKNQRCAASLTNIRPGLKYLPGMIYGRKSILQLKPKETNKKCAPCSRIYPSHK